MRHRLFTKPSKKLDKQTITERQALTEVQTPANKVFIQLQDNGVWQAVLIENSVKKPNQIYIYLYKMLQPGGRQEIMPVLSHPIKTRRLVGREMLTPNKHPLTKMP